MSHRLRIGSRIGSADPFWVQVREAVYQKAQQEQNTSPAAGLQFFGQVDIDTKTRAMTVTLKDLTGASLYAKTLVPQRA